MEANDVKAKVAEDQKLAEKSSEKIKKKKEEAEELEEIEAAANGRRFETKRYKPPHVIEGENAKDYIKHTEQMQKDFHEEHKFVVDGIKQEKQDELNAERERKAKLDEKSPEAKHLVDERVKNVPTPYTNKGEE